MVPVEALKLSHRKVYEQVQRQIKENPTLMKMNFFVPAKYVRRGLNSNVVMPILVRPKPTVKVSESEPTNGYESTFDLKSMSCRESKVIGRRERPRKGRAIKRRAHVKASMR